MEGFRDAMETAATQLPEEAAKTLYTFFDSRSGGDDKSELEQFCDDSAGKLDGCDTLDEIDDALDEIYDEADRYLFWLA